MSFPLHKKIKPTSTLNKSAYGNFPYNLDYSMFTGYYTYDNGSGWLYGTTFNQGPTGQSTNYNMPKWTLSFWYKDCDSTFYDYNGGICDQYTYSTNYATHGARIGTGGILGIYYYTYPTTYFSQYTEEGTAQSGHWNHIVMQHESGDYNETGMELIDRFGRYTHSSDRGDRTAVWCNGIPIMMDSSDDEPANGEGCFPWGFWTKTWLYRINTAGSGYYFGKMLSDFYYIPGVLLRPECFAGKYRGRWVPKPYSPTIGFDCAYSDGTKTYTASSEYNANYDANNPFLNFGQTASDTGRWLSASGDIAGAWVKVDHGSGVTKTVAKYMIRCDSADRTRNPKTWIIQGSNDDSTWTNLHRVTDFEWGSNNTISSAIYDVDVVDAYRYHRIYVIENNGHANYVSLIQFALYEKGTYYKSGNGWHSRCDDDTAHPLSVNDWDEYEPTDMDNGYGWTSTGNINSNRGSCDTPTNPDWAHFHPSFGLATGNRGYNYMIGGLNRLSHGNANWAISGIPFPMTTGKWYWEISSEADTAYWGAGLVFWNSYQRRNFDASYCSPADANPTTNEEFWCYNAGTGTVWSINDGSGDVDSADTPAANDIIQVAYDADNGDLWFGLNNTWYDSSAGTTGDPANGTNPCFTGISNTIAGYGPIPAVVLYSIAQASPIRFHNGNADHPFTYTPPTGFNTGTNGGMNYRDWSDAHQTISDEVQKFPYRANYSFVWHGNGDASRSLEPWLRLYGNNLRADVPTDLEDFSTDALIMIKCLDDSADPILWYDTERGATKYLDWQDGTAAQVTDADDGLTSFDSNGFTVGEAGEGYTNEEGKEYGCNMIKIGKKYGSDCVTYTGDANATQAITIDLAAKPTFMIAKKISDVGPWTFYHRGLNDGTTPELYAFTSSAWTPAVTDVWGDTAPTLNTVTVGDALNTDGDEYVLYVFTDTDNMFSTVVNNTKSSSVPYCTTSITKLTPMMMMIKEENADACVMIGGLVGQANHTRNHWVCGSTNGMSRSRRYWFDKMFIEPGSNLWDSTGDIYIAAWGQRALCVLDENL